MATSKKCKTTISLDDLTELLGMDSVEIVWDQISESGAGTYDDAYRQALEDGMSEEEAEATAAEAEEQEMFSEIEKYIDAVESVSEYLFGQHKLIVHIPTKKVRGKSIRVLDKIKIKPSETWKDAAEQIMETINGVGTFHFSSIREFLDSGPYTPCLAVMNHLHWIKRYPDVYGDKSIQKMIEDAMGQTPDD